MPVNFEFKARCSDIQKLENLLLSHNPLFIGEDHQVDTYFHAPNGRLKWREGNIENALIHYTRSNMADAKLSNVLLYQPTLDSNLKQLLTTALGIKVIVDKRRRIYFIDNIKFHFDIVAHLGTFVEVEAIDKEGTIGLSALKEQCRFYASLFGIQPENYVAVSYSDMLLQQPPV